MEPSEPEPIREHGLRGLTLWAVEDHPAANAALLEIGQALGAAVRGFLSAEEALDCADPSPDLVIADLRLPGIDGLALLRALRQRDPAPEVVVITAHGSVEQAVQAMNLGAADFLTKPMDIQRVEAVLRGAGARARLQAEVRSLRAADPHDETELLHRSAALGAVLNQASRAAQSTATVLILGESGTGKERLARLIHARSGRRQGPFVACHVAALAEGLLESELFGHERGAFTGATARREGVFERAAGGTLLLDEIGEIDARAQVRLLRVLQERTLVRVGGSAEVPIDVRLVCATNRDLEEEVAQGRFRADLFYRLDVVQLLVPPLRERREDIPILIAHFMEHFAARYGRPTPVIGPDVAAALMGYSWPGNVRELENVIERLVVMTRGLVDVVDLPRRLAAPSPPSSPTLPDGAVDLPAFLEEIERELVQRAIARAGGNQSQAARSLGVTREGLRYKLRKFGLLGG